jgi:hypothetical protein
MGHKNQDGNQEHPIFFDEHVSLLNKAVKETRKVKRLNRLWPYPYAGTIRIRFKGFVISTSQAFESLPSGIPME